MTEISVSVNDGNQTLFRGFLAVPLKFKRFWKPTIFHREIHGLEYIINVIFVLLCYVALIPSLPACPPPPHLQLNAIALLAQLFPFWSSGVFPVVVVTIKLIISISLYLISFIYFNHSLWEAPMFPHEWRLLKRAEIQRDVFSWHWGRDIHTTVFNDHAGVQAIRAHLRRAACPFDLWILQMKSRGETETNHLRFWKSFRMDRLSKLIGFEKALISTLDSLSLSLCCVCGVKWRKSKVAWVSLRTDGREFFKTEKRMQHNPPPPQNNVSMRPAARGWLWSLNCLALWQSRASEELWPSSAPLINSHSDRKPEPALQSAFMSHPICLQKPHFSLFTVSLPDWWSSILCKCGRKGGGSFWKKGLKCIIVCCWNIGLRYVLLVKPSAGCHSVTLKRRPCIATCPGVTIMNLRDFESGRKVDASVLWSGSAADKANNRQTQRSR